MSGATDILRALRDGPKTNRELQDITCDHGGGIARSCARLIRKGLVQRVDGERPGRGRPAVYALRPTHPMGASL